MTREEFTARTRNSVNYVVEKAGRYVAGASPVKEFTYRVVYPVLTGEHSYRFEELMTDEDGFINFGWQEGRFAFPIRVVLTGVEKGVATVQGFFSRRFIDETDEEWIARTVTHPHSESNYLPYFLRLPSPPKGWGVRDDQGMPDMELSLARNGQYPFPACR